MKKFVDSLKGLYWNTYYELINKGKPTYSAKNTGTILVTISLFLKLFVILGLLVWLIPDFGAFVEDLLDDIFFGSGRTMGKILALFGLAIIYIPVRLTWGTETGYQGIIDYFSALKPEEQEQASQQALYYFIGIIAVFFVFLLAIMIGTFA